MIDISGKIEKKEMNPFPIDIFSEEIQENFKFLAQEYSVPVGYLGTTALFAIAALSGNMYKTELNGRIRNSIYAVLVGESGVGKSIAFELLLENIISKRAEDLFAQYKEEQRKWEYKRDAAKKNKQEFTDPEPKWRIRMIQGGTMEGIMKHAEESTAGFGIYYAEGKSMMGTPDAYKKENNAVDFWNKMWDGGMFHEVRADSARERFITNSSISVLTGMQTDRIGSYFTKDTIDSGLSCRFLISISDIVTLNTEIDHFTDRGQACAEWQTLIRRLYDKGSSNFFKDDKPTVINFTEPAKKAFNAYSSRLTLESNINRTMKRAGDLTAVMIPYDTKLYNYSRRFLIPLAILDNFIDPVIDVKHIEQSEKLYRYFRGEAERVFGLLNNEHQTNLSQNERLLLEALPLTFSTGDAVKICARMSLADNFFQMAFRRKYSKGWIKNMGRGKWEKLIY